MSNAIDQSEEEASYNSANLREIEEGIFLLQIATP